MNVLRRAALARPKTTTGLRAHSIISNTEHWLEVCSTKDERKEFYLLGAESYKYGDVATHFIQNPEMRKPYLTAYFRCVFEEKLVKNKAFLGCMKKLDISFDGQSRSTPIYYSVCVFDTRLHHQLSDNRELMDIDKKATESLTRLEKLDEDIIHAPLRKMAEDLGTEAWYHAHQMTVEKYKRQGFATMFLRKLMDAGYENRQQEFIKQNRNPEIAPILYAITSDMHPKMLKLVYDCGYEKIGQFFYKSESGCAISASTKDWEDDGALFLVDKQKLTPFFRKKVKQYVKFE